MSKAIRAKAQSLPTKSTVNSMLGHNVPMISFFRTAARASPDGDIGGNYKCRTQSNGD
jgi:hypothetical protein